MRFIFILVVSILTSSAMAIAPKLDKLDNAIDSALKENRIVGAVVLVSWKGKLIYERSAGWSDREANVPMTSDALFRLSSLSKPIVSAAALALVDRGILNLNDPVAKWLPEFRPQFMGAEQVITIKHIMTHTAGLSYTFFEPENGPYHAAGILDGTEKGGVTLLENLVKLSQIPLLFPPGAAWLYSLGTDVLGLVIERASGLTLQEAVKKYVTAPLNMKDTDFSSIDNSRLTAAYMNSQPEPVRMVEGQKVPFAASFITFSPDRATDKNAYASGGSGMVGTAKDYMTFLESVRKNTNLLSSSSLEGLTTNQIGDVPVTMYPGCGWSLGFMIVKDPQAMGALVRPGTYQWGGAYGHLFWVDPTEELSVVILTNTSMEALTGKLPADVQMALYL